MKPTTLLLGLAPFITALGCGRRAEPSLEAFKPGMEAYLEVRGDLCVGKTEWPIDVTPRELETGSRNAVQMPVLERLGLVTATNADVTPEGATLPIQVRRYRLTDEGKRHYRRRNLGVSAGHEPGAPAFDLCMARLSLGKVVSWEAEGKAGTPAERATVTYTYSVDAPSWTAEPSLRAAFPAVARVLDGANSAQLKEGFTLTPRGWTANELLGTDLVASRN